MPPRFALIELDRVPRVAWMAEKLGRRIRFVLEDGTSALEPARCVLYEWEGATDEGEAGAMAELRAHAPRLEQPAFDAAALHARIGEGQTCTFQSIAGLLLENAASGWERAALYQALLREEGHFRPARDGFVARSAVEMSQIAERTEVLRHQRAWLERVAQWRAALEHPSPSPHTGRGATVPIPGWNADDPEAREFLAQIESLLVLELRSPHWKALARLLDLLPHDWTENRVRLKRLLEAAGAWRGWERLWRLGAGVPERFPPPLLDRTADLAARPVQVQERTEYRGRPTYSFDSPGTRDFDDAVTILSVTAEAVEVSAHVADVACALVPGDPLFEEAARRLALYRGRDRPHAPARALRGSPFARRGPGSRGRELSPAADARGYGPAGRGAQPRARHGQSGL